MPRRPVLTGVIVTAALGLAGNLATDTVQVTWRWWPWAAWTAVVLLIAAAGLLELPGRGAGPADDDGLDRAVRRLTAKARRQWVAEAALRRLRQPLPLQVRWSSTGRPVAAAREVVLDDAAGTEWRSLPLTGNADEIAAAFRGLPNRQLVVLGEPGAGKSMLALLLALNLLERPEAGEPVPVLLPIASWDPNAEHVEAFVARRMVEEYRFLAGAGDRTAALLVDEGRVVPILDGLDEMRPEWHAAAIAELDRLVVARRPLVVTCRSKEYARAVEHGGLVLSRAAVVELEPVRADDAIAFLSHPPQAGARWQPVFEHLREEPDGVVAGVLSTPLMVSLARTAFMGPASDPRDLLADGDGGTVRARLMDGYLASIYRREPRAPLADRTLRRYDLDRATRWLNFLAFVVYRSATRELTWSDLDPGLVARKGTAGRRFAIGAALLGLLLLPAAAALGLAAGLHAWGWAAAVRALAPDLWPFAGVAAVLALAVSPLPERVPWGLRRELVRFLLIGAAVALIRDAGYVAAAAGGGVAAVLWFVSFGWSLPALAVRRAISGGLAFLATSGFVESGAALWRTTLLAAALCAVIGLLSDFRFQRGLRSRLRSRLVRIRLAWRGDLPWRLRRFLDDAARRGAMRRSGTVWLFRHALLQDHLALPVRIERLRAEARAGHRRSLDRAVAMLTGLGREGEARALLREQADRADRYATGRLVGLLVGDDRPGEAETLLRTLSRRGDSDATHRLADLLIGADRLDEALALLRGAAARRDWSAAERLAGLLEADGRTDELLGFWRERAAPDRLVDALLAAQRTAEAIEELTRRYRSGALDTADRLVDLLLAHGRSDEARALLRERADAGRWHPARRLALVLAADGEVAEAVGLLQRGMAAGDRFAAYLLAGLLLDHDRTDEALAVLAGFDTARAAHLLIERSRIDPLIALLRGRAGDRLAHRLLAAVLRADGRIDEAAAVLRSRPPAPAPSPPRRRLVLPRFGRRAIDRRFRALEDKASVRRADELEAAGDLDGALRELNKLRYPGSEQFSLRRAGLLFRLDRPDEAMAVLRRWSDAGYVAAAEELARRLALAGELDEAVALLRVRADLDDAAAPRRIAELLAGGGDVDAAIALLRERVAGGDAVARGSLAVLLLRSGRPDEAVAALPADRSRLEARAALTLARQLVGQDRRALAIELLRAQPPGAGSAVALETARLLREDGQAEESLAVLRAAHDRGVTAVARPLAEQLANAGRFPDAIEVLFTDSDGERELVDLLVLEGRIDELSDWLRRRTDGGSWWLPNLLFLPGHEEEEIAWYRQGRDPYASPWRLADVLERHGRVDEAIDSLRAVMISPHLHWWYKDGEAGARLVQLLADHGRADDLRARVKAGDRRAARPLAHLLADLGDHDEAIALLGGGEAERSLGAVLVQAGRTREAIDLLTGLADRGDTVAAGRLAELLAADGDAGRLRLRADAGDREASRALAALLADRGDVDELRARVVARDSAAVDRLTSRLAEQGDEAGLRALAAGGWRSAQDELARLLTGQARLPELHDLRSSEFDHARDVAMFLAEHGQPDAALRLLRLLVHARDRQAVLRLADVLHAQQQDPAALVLLRTRIDYDDPVTRHLAALMLELGRPQDSITLLRSLRDPEYADHRQLELLVRARRRGGVPDSGSFLHGPESAGQTVAGG
ncbi:hypothetical protein [Dactylosporangium sp. CS-033363]|uniref:hypothetical protein n=1 Tax=Dactylosporangium sp. CS-033363 TaxID=3239935 RepID=UPI003D905B0F